MGYCTICWEEGVVPTMRVWGNNNFSWRKGDICPRVYVATQNAWKSLGPGTAQAGPTNRREYRKTSDSLEKTFYFVKIRYTVGLSSFGLPQQTCHFMLFLQIPQVGVLGSAYQETGTISISQNDK